MNEMEKRVTKKKVTISCYAPFRIGFINYTGTMRDVVLSVDEISKCLEHKCSVVEHLDNGITVPLDFTNYNIYNGPTKVTNDTKLFYEREQQKIPIKENGKIINEDGRNIGKKKTLILGTKNNNTKSEFILPNDKPIGTKVDLTGNINVVQSTISTASTSRNIENTEIVKKEEKTVKQEEIKKEFDYNNNNFTSNKKKNKF